MTDFKAGFTLLKERKFKEAYQYFNRHVNIQKDKKPFNLVDYNKAQYGKARALWVLGTQGQKNGIADAIAIFQQLISEQPHWEPPYISLARLYEETDCIKEADEIYLAALNHTSRSDKLCKTYEWFLLNYRSTEPAITPAFGMHTQPTPLVDPEPSYPNENTYTHQMKAKVT